MATISDVAKKAGVSIATVSYVLNGRTELVREETAERIRLAAKELNYSASPMARGLATGSSYTVAVVLPDHYTLSHPIGSQEFLGVAEEFYLSNYSIVVKPSYKDERRILQAHRSIPRHVAGVMVLGPMTLDNPDLAEARELNKPLVVSEDVPEEWDLVSINVDNFAAARMVTGRVIEMGHRRIGVISHASMSACMDRRRDGVSAALDDNGLDTDSVVATEVTQVEPPDAVCRATKELLDSTPRPTAIVAMGSALMPGIAETIKKRRISVPDDLVVGCVDYGMPPRFLVEWPVVTLSHDRRQQGELAARTLIAMLKSKGKKAESKLIMPKLMVLEP